MSTGWLQREDLEREVEESEGLMYPTAMRSLLLLSGKNSEKRNRPSGEERIKQLPA
jgi:hypothetical protein